MPGVVVEIVFEAVVDVSIDVGVAVLEGVSVNVAGVVVTTDVVYSVSVPVSYVYIPLEGVTVVPLDVVGANQGVVDSSGDVPVVVSTSVAVYSVVVVVLYAVVSLEVSSCPGVYISSMPVDGVSVKVTCGVVPTDSSVVLVVLCHVCGWQGPSVTGGMIMTLQSILNHLGIFSRYIIRHSM